MSFNWKAPEYAPVFRQRLDVLERIRADPTILPALRVHYRDNPADFINDWGVTYDPRNAERGLPTIVPFLLFERQRDWINWLIRHWRSQTPGITLKSRDMGVSWLGIATACTLCLFHEGLAIGFGSRKEDYVDRIGTLKPLLPKGRMFMEYLPEEFKGGWTSYRDAPFMRINFPNTGSIITGEAGDQIGRGDRASIYFVDESSHLQQPELVDASLSQTTNCRIDVSTPNGPNNPFAMKVMEGKIDLFTFDWREDPRKDQEWYDKLPLGEDEGGKGLDPITIAQEVDHDFSASVTGIIIPGEWLRSCVDAIDRLGLSRSGKRGLALDVADEGADKNGLVGATGVEIDYLEEWSGKGTDIFSTVQHAFDVCDRLGVPGFRYDADGLGAGVRGDARIINETRNAARVRSLVVAAYRGSEGVLDPDGKVDGVGMGSDVDARTNADYFKNRKSQNWWAFRRRCQKTHRWVTEGIACAPDDILSINTKSCGKLWSKLVAELGQPTYAFDNAGKMKIDKKPGAMPSPNLADAAVIRMARAAREPLNITPDAIAQIKAIGARRRMRR